MLHKPKRKNNYITTIRTSNESHLHGKNHFHKNPLYFRIYADFEADNGDDNFSIGIKTINIYKQKPILNGYRKKSDLEDVLTSGYHKSPLGYSNVDCFVKEAMKLENEMTFYFKKTKKNIIMTRKMKKIIEIITFVDFVKTKLNVIKIDIIVT